MKCLILGGTGMLGHRLWVNLSHTHPTWVTVRGSADLFPDHRDFNKSFVLEHINVLKWDDLLRVVGEIQPDVIINCVGLIKQHARANDPMMALEINALLPHRLALLCKAIQARLIHISTDCVFSGNKGSYREEDVSDAQDLYGRTKFLGETSDPHTVTLRTSFVGPELATGHGLLAWFLRQQQPVKGFKKAIYSGFTSDELSRILIEYVLPNHNVQGLYQLSSDPISKYELLQLFNEAFGCGLTIEAESDFVCDRSLLSDRFKELTGYVAPAWPEMVASMANTYKSYDSYQCGAK